VTYRMAEQPQIERGLAAVAAHLEHVVFIGPHPPVADVISPVPQLAHDVQLGIGRHDDDGLGGALPVCGARGERGDGEPEVLGGLDVGGQVPAAEHFRHVGEPGEPGALPEAVSPFGGHLDLGDGLPEGRGPGVEVGYPRSLEQVGPQVALHDVGLGDAVGDRGGGGEGDDPGAVAAAQVADLHVQVAGPPGPVDRGVGDVGRGAQVLVPVGLVDEEVVDAGGLEGDARVPGRVELLLQPLFRAQQGAFESLDGQPVAFPGGGDEVPHPVKLGVHVLGLGGGAHRDPLEP
jgi:hypothetical protein